MASPRFTHTYTIAFAVHTDSPADQVDPDEIVEAIHKRADSLTTAQHVDEAVGDPESTIDTLSVKIVQRFEKGKIVCKN